MRRCLFRIFNQTYTDIEVILVNDGSTDLSGDICNHYAKHYDQVTVIHQQNKGPAAARNIGMAHAKGTFIQFIDADDTVKRTMTEKLVETMKSDTTLAICAYETDEKVITPSISGHFSQETFLQHVGRLYRDIILPSVCNKMYRADVIQQRAISFPEGDRFGEDLTFNLHYLHAVQTVRVIDDVLYEYNQRDATLTTSYIPHMYVHYKTLYYRMVHFLHHYDCFHSENKKYINETVANGIVHTLSNLFHQDSNLSKQERRDLYKQMITDPFFIRLLPYFKGNMQARFIRWIVPFTKRGTYTFLQMKETIRMRAHPVFRLLQKMNRTGY